LVSQPNYRGVWGVALKLCVQLEVIRPVVLKRNRTLNEGTHEALSRQQC